MFSKQNLGEIVERASTFYERLMRGNPPPEDPRDQALIARRLEDWCQAAADGDWARFEKRLAWDGLDLQSVRAYLGTTFGTGRAPGTEALPDWVKTLDECVRLAAHANSAGAARFLNPDQPLPFEELHAPFVEWVRRQLRVRAGAAYDLLSDSAQRAFERALLERLSWLSASTLYLEFRVFRAERQSSLALFLSQLQSSDSADLYREFVDSLFHGHLVEFFKEYTVLGRQIATVIQFWIETVAEFLARLQRDQSEIARAFNGGTDLGQVQQVRLGLSDRHNGGRSVMIVTFASGLKLVYKPKNLDLEVAFFDLLNWLNQKGAPLPLKTLQVLARADYGWVEFADHLPCRDPAEAQRFFKRMGMLTGIVYALEGSDYHCENVIASGEHPVLVDMETLLHPLVLADEERTDHPAAQLLAARQLGDSVLRTGILPRWLAGPAGRSIDISGLGGFEGQETAYQQAQWQSMNRDIMQLEYRSSRLGAENNLPVLEDRVLNPDDYREEYADGFQAMYRFLLARRAELLDGDTPYTCLARQPVRFVFRATRIYALLGKKADQPEFLRHGLDRSIALDALSYAFTHAPAKPADWAILHAEHRALAQLDIPYFTTYTDTTALPLTPAETLRDYFERPSYTRSVERIQQLNEADLARQLRFIQESFFARMAAGEGRPVAALPAAFDATTLPPPSRDELIQAARRIAQELAARAIRSENGGATWIGLEYELTIERFQLRPLGFNLYGGTPGIGLFLAALARSTGESGYRELALGAVQNLRDTFEHGLERFARTMPIGGFSGLGSLVYGLLRMGDFLDDESLLDDARRVAALISRDRIGADRALDIIGGAAGALLALLALYRRTRDSVVLQQAMECGEHLLKTRRASQAGYQAWPTIEGKLITGFSHGAAGIAYALLELYAMTGDRRFHAAAVEGRDYEHSVFVAEAGNWPDYRKPPDPDGRPAFMTAWCHGAPGIGLGRLASLSILDTPETRREIEIALQTTQGYGLQGADHLCCGNMSRTEFLLQAGRRLARPELIELAERHAGWLLARAQANGALQLFHNLPLGAYNPSFMQGSAGVGYGLLQIAETESALPCVLLLE